MGGLVMRLVMGRRGRAEMELFEMGRNSLSRWD